MLTLAILVFGFCSQPNKEQQDSDNPNILLILADDMGWSDLGCYGGEIETPNLDSLAYNGIRFTKFYNTSKCFPSRAALLTGLYAQQVGAGATWRNSWLSKTTLGSVMKSAGYNTFWSGKHHGVDHPVDDLGFDGYYGLWDGASNHFNPGEQRNGEPKPAQKRSRKWVVDGKVYSPYTPDSRTFYTTDAFTGAALDWLSKNKASDNPFFLYLAYTAPHDPLMAWPEDIEKYKDTYKVGYELIRQQRFEKQKQLSLIDGDLRLSEPSFTRWEELSDEKKEEESLKMAVYAAMTDRLDQNIGRLVDYLKKSGKYENTLIIFLSDNGASAEVVNIPGNGQIGTMGQWTSLGPDWANVSNTPFRYYKNYSYEGGINTPVIVHWPEKIKEGYIEMSKVGHFIDVLPSLINITGLSKNDQLPKTQGKPVLLPSHQLLERQLYWEWQDGRAIREGKWKMVVEGEGPWELYDLEKDPFETQNVANSQPEVVEKLERAFNEWQKKNNLHLKK